MQMTAADMAWMKAQALYQVGDTAEQAGNKALQEGYSPGTQAYAAFVNGFMEMVNAERQSRRDSEN